MMIGKTSGLLALCLASQLTANQFASAATYTVQSGDTLETISNNHKTSMDRVANANKLFSTVLEEGRQLEIPNPNVHIVKAGDTIHKLSIKYRVSKDHLKQANPQIANYEMIYPGQFIKIPMKKQMGHYMGNTSEKQIALTFDDGPDEKYTPEILKILKEKKVKATFFVIGERIKDYPDVMKQIEKDGHAIGNHTWNHPNITTLTDKELEKTVQSTSKAIEKTTGVKTNLFRPPFGEMKDQQVEKLNEQGIQSILWTADTKDWDGMSAKKIVAEVNMNASPGVIVLQHSYHATGKFETVKALPKIIDNLREKGYKFVTVPKIIEE